MPSAKFTLHHRFGMISTRSEHTTTHQNHNFSCGAWDWPRKNRYANPQCHSNIQHPKSTTLQTAYKTMRTCTVKSLRLHASTSYVSACFLANSHKSDTSCFHPKPCPKASPNVNAIALLPADGCGRLRTVTNGRQRLRTL